MYRMRVSWETSLCNWYEFTLSKDCTTTTTTTLSLSRRGKPSRKIALNSNGEVNCRELARRPCTSVPPWNIGKIWKVFIFFICCKTTCNIWLKPENHHSVTYRSTRSHQKTRILTLSNSTALLANFEENWDVLWDKVPSHSFNRFKQKEKNTNSIQTFLNPLSPHLTWGNINFSDSFAEIRD